MDSDGGREDGGREDVLGSDTAAADRLRSLIRSEWERIVDE